MNARLSLLERACRVPGSGIATLCALSTLAGGALARRAPRLAGRLAQPLADVSLGLGCLFLASVGATARLAELVRATGAPEGWLAARAQDG